MRQHMRMAVLIIFFCTLHAKILRNNALMTKMISHFQQDNNLSNEPKREHKKRASHELEKQQERQVAPIETEQTKSPYRHNNRQDRSERHDRQDRQMRQERTDRKDRQERKDKEIKDRQKPADVKPTRNPEKVLNLMQTVLCKNFPSIPCNIIMQDRALKKLISQSIQQITNKKLKMEQTTQQTMIGFFTPTLSPLIDSEDLSNFLEVSNTGYFDVKENQQKTRKKKKLASEKKMKNKWSHDGPSRKKLKGTTDSKRGTELYTGRKKMRKFYPHKIKYKDKNSKTNQAEFRSYDDKGSMSAEMPDLGNVPKSERIAYNGEQSDSPVWRIDYMKHGVPSLNVFEYEDGRLRTKLMKTPHPEDVALQQPAERTRKEVLHPDVYIKSTNFFRKSENTNSDVLE